VPFRYMQHLDIIVKMFGLSLKLNIEPLVFRILQQLCLPDSLRPLAVSFVNKYLYKKNPITIASQIQTILVIPVVIAKICYNLQTEITLTGFPPNVELSPPALWIQNLKESFLTFLPPNIGDVERRLRVKTQLNNLPITLREKQW